MKYRRSLGAKLKNLRKMRDWTLADMSKRTGVPLSSLSKIENNQLSPTYDQLLKISAGLAMDIAQLLLTDTAATQPTIAGRRSINRRNDGIIIDDGTQTLRYLSSDLLQKGFTPLIADVKARSLTEYSDFLRHPGEEFVYVIEGSLDLYTELYAPIRLCAGESIYFDSNMGHAYIAVGDNLCRVLSICSYPRVNSSQNSPLETVHDESAPLPPNQIKTQR